MSSQDSGPADGAREIHLVRFYDDRDGDFGFEADFRPVVLPASHEDPAEEPVSVPKESAPEPVEESAASGPEGPVVPAKTPAKKALPPVPGAGPGKQTS